METTTIGQWLSVSAEHLCNMALRFWHLIREAVVSQPLLQMEEVTLSNAISWVRSIFCALARCPIQNWAVPVRSAVGAFPWVEMRLCTQLHRNRLSELLS